MGDEFRRLRHTRLTDSPAKEIDPAFSPDGSKIIFASNRDGDFDLYVMNADGSGQTKLTNDAARDFAPAFSPDGSKIAFETLFSTGSSVHVHVMNADGSARRSLTDDSPDGAGPSFSLRAIVEAV